MQLSSPKHGYEWLLPLMDYVPASLLAGYIAALRGFNRFGDPESPFANRSIYTLSNSKIEIYG